MNRRSQRGLTMIEIAIALLMIALLSTLAVPAFQGWVQNSQIRNAADGIINGLQLARAEALRRNKPVELRMGVDSTWTIIDVTTSAEIETRPSTEGSSGTSVAITPAGADRVTFNGMGWLTNNNNGSAPITAFNLNSKTMAGQEGIRPLRVVISSGGAMRMCDPAVAAGDPRACP